MLSSRADLQQRLWALAGEQSGYFTAAQAKGLGYAYPQQSYHVGQGNWTRVERGLFRLPHFPTGQHDDLVRASLWSHRNGTPSGVVSHESATAVHDLGELDPIRTHLTVPPLFRAQHPAVVLHRGILDEVDVETRSGFLVTTPARTLVDVAWSLSDADQVENALHDALDRHLVTPRAVRAAADRAPAEAARRIERVLSLAGR